MNVFTVCGSGTTLSLLEFKDYFFHYLSLTLYVFVYPLPLSLSFSPISYVHSLLPSFHPSLTSTPHPNFPYKQIRVRARRFPALIMNTAIDFFHPWPRDALISVAHVSTWLMFYLFYLFSYTYIYIFMNVHVFIYLFLFIYLVYINVYYLSASSF